MSLYRKITAERERQQECARLQQEYPYHIPLVVEHQRPSRALLLALPQDSTVAELEQTVQQAFNVRHHHVSLTIEGLAIGASAPMVHLYERFKDAHDGFLYVLWTRQARHHADNAEGAEHE